MKFIAEHTDTFGGDANYSWVTRRTFEAPENATTALLVRRAKRALDITGRHKTEEWGETIAIRPAGECTIVFISAIDPEDEHRMGGRI